MNIRDFKAFRRLEYNRWELLEVDQRMRLNLLLYVRKAIKKAKYFSAGERVLPSEDSSEVLSIDLP